MDIFAIDNLSMELDRLHATLGMVTEIIDDDSSFTDPIYGTHFRDRVRNNCMPVLYLIEDGLETIIENLRKETSK